MTEVHCGVGDLPHYVGADDDDDFIIHISPPADGYSALTLNIRKNVTLFFPEDAEITIRSIVLSGSVASISGLNMKSGTILVQSYATLHLRNSEIHHPATDAESLISVCDNSQCFAEGCRFHDSLKKGIYVDRRSELSLVDCSMANLAKAGFHVTSGSRATALRSRFAAGGIPARAEMDSELYLTSCTFSDCENVMVHGSRSKVEMRDCQFSNCGSGAISVVSCPSVRVHGCTIRGSGQTAVYIDRSCLVFTLSTIESCRGNGINGIHNSSLKIESGTFRDTSFPAVAVCDGSRAVVDRCHVRGCELSGIIIRNHSSARLSRIALENAGGHGVVVSESRDVRISFLYVANVRYSGLCVYNHSTVCLTRSVFMGPGDVGINVFTGAQISCSRVIIAGIGARSLWVHHGGSSRVVSALLHPQIFDSHCEQPAQLLRDIPLNADLRVDTDGVYRFETGREVMLLGSIVVGRGVVNVVENESNSPPDSGDGLGSVHCKLCNGPTEFWAFAPCGHSIFCRRCWGGIAEKPTTCELCMVGIDRMVTPLDCSWGGEKAVCPICTEAEPNGMVVPCGHMICMACAKTWFSDNGLCPYCGVKGAKFRAFVAHQ
jgi:hypothetical protein